MASVVNPTVCRGVVHTAGALEDVGLAEQAGYHGADEGVHRGRG